MNEFDLQAWERELDAWQRRLATQLDEVPQLRAELALLRLDLEALRQHPESEGELRASVERRLHHLLALYDHRRRRDRTPRG
jgi:hypothetical protein